MNRTINYKISKESNRFRIEQFLKHKGYSSQNITQIKRMPKSVLVNGQHCYMRDTLNRKMIARKRFLLLFSLLILYMKMKILLLLINPPECQSILPWIITRILWQMLLLGITSSKTNLSFSGAVIVLTEIRPVSPLLRNILSAEIFYPAWFGTTRLSANIWLLCAVM